MKIDNMSAMKIGFVTKGFRKTRTGGPDSRRLAAMLFPIVLASFCATNVAVAEEWPTKPVTVVYPYKPGGGGDQMVRIVTSRLSEKFGQQFIVDNRGGAGGSIGSAVVAKARPDGYTLVVSGIGSHVIAPETVKVPYDPVKDFTHIALFGGAPQVVMVRADSEIKTLKQYVSASQSIPEGIAFGSPGPGTHGHLSGELFKSLSGANLLHIPYSGGGQALADLLGGAVPSAFVTFGLASQQLRSGKLRALAVSSINRMPEFPDLPTFIELGYKDLNAVTWFGLSGPANMPRDIVVKLNSAVRAVMAEPEVRKKMQAEGVQLVNLDPEAYTNFLIAERTRWGPVARSSKK